MELETNIPNKYLHIYLQYCAYTKSVIIIRPVSDSVPDLYAGTSKVDRAHSAPDGTPLISPPSESVADTLRYSSTECRVMGKSIQVSLKSSPYPPIDGCIPVNPALGKAYIDAQRREREIEDMLLNSATGLATVFVRKLKAQKAQASAMTAAFVRDTKTALRGSSEQFERLMSKYKQELVSTTDKLSVSNRYIDKFNNAQFLGVAGAKWRDWYVYYSELPNSSGSVLRDDMHVPVFHIRKDNDYYLYSAAERDVSKEPATPDVVADLHPVEIVTHRTFYISKATNRIEEEQSPYIIGPDFDGLSYAQNYLCDETGNRRSAKNRYTAQDHINWALEVTNLRARDGMGLTSELDETHINVMRFLTDWKQNHGYECHNVIKSQPITHGNYVCITPTSFFILRDFDEIITFYRSAWKDGTPLLLNPSWKVAIRRDGLPCCFGDELSQSIVDDCGYADLTMEVERYEKTFEVQGIMRKLSQQYIKMKDRSALSSHQSKSKVTKMMNFASADTILSLAELEAKYTLCFDKKAIAAVFFELRRWQLLPPRFCFDEVEDEKDVLGQSQRLDPIKRQDSTKSDKLSSIEAHYLPMDSKSAQMCSVFEDFRKSKVVPLKAQFEHDVNLFDELHPDAEDFTDNLLHFVYTDAES
jgi:hypothetical protein